MNDQTTPAGAMPVAASAMLAQSYPSGPVFAAYRLPYPGAPGAREAGVCFEGEPGTGGATPPAGGTPPTPPAGDPPPPPPTPPATGDPGDLGDAGKRALAEERAARKAAEKLAADNAKRIEELENASKSDSEKAIAQAKKDGAAEVLVRVHDQVRRSEVKAALTAAGINPSVLDLATKADEFAALKVSDDGEVEGLAAAVEAFKKARVDLFTKPAAAGSADGGARGDGKTITREQIKSMSPAEINAAFEKGELGALLKPTN